MKYATSLIAALLAIVLSTTEAHAEDDWFGTDKVLHFGVSVALSGGGYAASALVFDRKWERATAGAAFSLTLGATKELYDLAGHGDASWKDFTWDVVGTAVGTGIALLVDVAVSGSNRVESSDRPVGLAVRF
jgi:putative lipoprotein